MLEAIVRSRPLVLVVLAYAGRFLLDRANVPSPPRPLQMGPQLVDAYNETEKALERSMLHSRAILRKQPDPDAEVDDIEPGDPVEILERALTLAYSRSTPRAMTQVHVGLLAAAASRGNETLCHQLFHKALAVDDSIAIHLAFARATSRLGNASLAHASFVHVAKSSRSTTQEKIEALLGVGDDTAILQAYEMLPEVKFRRRQSPFEDIVADVLLRAARLLSSKEVLTPLLRANLHPGLQQRVKQAHQLLSSTLDRRR